MTAFWQQSGQGTVFIPVDVDDPNATRFAQPRLLYENGVLQGISDEGGNIISSLRADVGMFGAVGDGITNDTPAFQAAIDYVSSIGGGTVTFSKKHLLDTSLIIKDYVTLEGPLGLPDEILPATVADYDSKKGVLVVNPAATITTNDSASLCNCVVIRKDLNLPFTSAAEAAAGVLAFSGTAITVGGAGSYFHHLLILGFNTAIYSSNFERIRCEYVQGDCTNGIDLRTVFDIAYVENCHFWPWTTTHQSWTFTSVPPSFTAAGSLLTRTGTAYRFAATNDWSKLTNCFSFGYANGFVVDSSNNVNIIGCGADYYGAITGSTSVGFTVSGTSKNTMLSGCQAAAQGTGILVDISASPGRGVRILGCNTWNNDTAAVSIQNGRALIQGCEFRSEVTGVTVNASSLGISLIGNDFDTCTTPISISGAAERQSTILGNRYTAGETSVDSRVAGGAGNTVIRFAVSKDSTSGFDLCGDQSGGTLAAPTLTQANATTLRVFGRVYDGTAYRSVGSMRFQAQGTPAANNTPGQIIFATTPTGSSSMSDRISIYQDGSIAPLADNAQTCGATGLRWSAVWAANGTIQTSDERTKKDIEDSVLGLSFINDLRPVSYKFKVGGVEVVRQIYRDEEGKECSPDDEGAMPAELVTKEKAGERTHWGLIAQEVKEACDKANVDFGGWVLTDVKDEDSPQALRYDQFIAPLIKAVQELSSRIEKLETKG